MPPIAALKKPALKSGLKTAKFADSVKANDTPHSPMSAAKGGAPVNPSIEALKNSWARKSGGSDSFAMTDQELQVEQSIVEEQKDAFTSRLYRSWDRIVDEVKSHRAPGDQRSVNGEVLKKDFLRDICQAIRTMAPVAIMMVSTDGVILDANQKTADIFNIDREGLPGLALTKLMPPDVAVKHDGFLKTYKAKWEEKGRAPRSSVVGNRGREVIASRKKKDGAPEAFPARVLVRPVPHPSGAHLPPLFFVGYIEDLSEQRKLKDAVEVNQFCLEKGATAIITMDHYGKILEFNNAASDMFRYNRKFILGQNIKKLMPPHIAADHDEKLAQHRQRFSTGMDHSSPVVRQVRHLTGYRPKFDEPGMEEFSLELRVEAFNAGATLVAFVKDLSMEKSNAFAQGTTSDMFPAHTHARLMENEAVWDEQHNVTILFAHVRGFSKKSKSMAAKEVFDYMNGVVSAFDDLGFAMEKVKTIGSCYMSYFTSTDDALLSSIRMLEWCREKEIPVRIGLHTGTAVSGVIGTKRRTFDIWGDVVNTAKRMEEQGVDWQIQISTDCFDSLETDELRGLFIGHSAMVKGKGVFDTYVTDIDDEGLPDYVEEMLIDREVQERSKSESG